MDLKAQIEQLASRVMKDEALKKQFLSDPVKAVEQLLGVDLPDDAASKIASGVKAKLASDNACELLGKLKKLF